MTPFGWGASGMVKCRAEVAAGPGTTVDANGRVITTEITPTGKILCKVEVPPEYATVARTRLGSIERVDETIIPARFETITKEVVDQPWSMSRLSVRAARNRNSAEST